MAITKVPIGMLDSDSIAESILDDTKDDIALLGFKVAANGSLSAYGLNKQTIDAFEDTSGVDAGASSSATRNASSYYSGGVSVAGATTGFTTTGANTWTAPDPAPSTIEVLIVAGGGGGGRSGSGFGTAGGGGAGGVVHHTTYSVTAGVEYDITVGNGGGGGTSGVGSNGQDSVFNVNGEGSNTDVLTAKGGGGGGGHNAAGASGGHGGGGGYTNNGGSSTQGSFSGATVYGYAGNNASGDNAGGGGGAANNLTSSKDGENGVQFSNFTSYGNSGYFAAGGGGGRYVYAGSPNAGCGGFGSGSTRIGGNAHGQTCGNTNTTGAGYPGTANTGSGGGAGVNANGGSGGSGFVGIHYDSFSTYNNMTLVSNASTADAAPDKADIVMTYTNGAGTATINTDLKAYVSRDGGTTWTQATLVADGTSGGHNILVAHNIDISSQPSGTSMKYKIETLNQSASKETRIQAVSLGWK